MKGMIRVRRKFALIISGVILAVFIFLYFVINSSVPSDEEVRHCFRLISSCVLGDRISTHLIYYTCPWMALSYTRPLFLRNCLFIGQVGYRTIEDKLRELELGLNKHKYEVGEIKKQINTIEENERHTWRLDTHDSRADPPETVKSSRKLVDKSAQCTFRTDVVPAPDIQVCGTHNGAWVKRNLTL